MAPAPSTDATAIEALITPERLSSYTRVTRSSDEAIQLYEWNMDLAGAVLHLTGMVEVLARNALDSALLDWAQQRHGTDEWFDVIPLDHQGGKDLAKARERATKNGRHTERHGKVIAELNFGFWRYLVEKRYLTSLWIPAMADAFSHGDPDLRQRGIEVRSRMAALHLSRNRAAHHEPLHTCKPAKDRDDAIALAQWISPAAGAWVDRLEQITAVLARRPH